MRQSCGAGRRGSCAAATAPPSPSASRPRLRRVTDLGRCLVTGAGGFIGSHLVEELSRRGTPVRALARYNGRGDTGWLATVDEEVRDEVEIVLGDVRDPDQMRRLV